MAMVEGVTVPRTHTPASLTYAKGAHWRGHSLTRSRLGSHLSRFAQAQDPLQHLPCCWLCSCCCFCSVTAPTCCCVMLPVTCCCLPCQPKLNLHLPCHHYSRLLLLLQPPLCCCMCCEALAAAVMPAHPARSDLLACGRMLQQQRCSWLQSRCAPRLSHHCPERAHCLPALLPWCHSWHACVSHSGACAVGGVS